MAARILGPAAGDLSDPGDVFDAWVQVPAHASAGERMDVYAAGYPSRLYDALLDTYPAVAALAGAEAFAALAGRFAAAAALTSYNLNDVGADLPAFLRTDRLAVELPYLPDLAELEWRVAAAFHAAERPPLDPRRLGWTIEEWATAVLEFQPAVAVLSSPWPLLDLWEHHRLDVAPQPQHVVVRRVDLIVRCEVVAAEEARCLQLLLGRRSLAQTAEQLERDGVDPSIVTDAFSRWTAAGMVVGAAR